MRKPLTNLKRIRLKLEMSQNDFGDMLGIKRTGTKQQSYYRKHETGEVDLPLKTILVILRTFTISFEEAIS